MEPKSWRFGRWISQVAVVGFGGRGLIKSQAFSSPTLDQPWNLACSNPSSSLLPPVITFLMSRSTWILKVHWIWFFHCNYHVFVAKCLHFAFEPPPQKKSKCLEVRPSRPSSLFKITLKTIKWSNLINPLPNPILTCVGCLFHSRYPWLEVQTPGRFWWTTGLTGSGVPRANHRLDIPKTL